MLLKGLEERPSAHSHLLLGLKAWTKDNYYAWLLGIKKISSMPVCGGQCEW